MKKYFAVNDHWGIRVIEVSMINFSHYEKNAVILHESREAAMAAMKAKSESRFQDVVIG